VERRYQFVHQQGPLLVGSDLGLEVADVVRQVAGAAVALKQSRGGQQRRDAVLLEHSALYQLEGDDRGALLHQGLRVVVDEASSRGQQ